MAAILMGLSLMPFACVAYPYVYNYRLAPLARLHKRVHVGDDCAATARAFAAYYAREKADGNEDVQFADGSTDDTVEFTRLTPPRRLLHLYDLAIMDDVQLTAICDPSGRRVEQVYYLGD